MELTQGSSLEHSVQVIEETATLGPRRHLLQKASHLFWESQKFYLIYGNKYKKAVKMGNQRNRSQMGEEEPPEKI